MNSMFDSNHEILLAWAVTGGVAFLLWPVYRNTVGALWGAAIDIVDMGAILSGGWGVAILLVTIIYFGFSVIVGIGTTLVALKLVE